MKLRVVAPLLTYPDASTPSWARTAAAISKLLDADLHALALEADIPSVSNALSRVLIDVPEMIRQAERLSARNGADLLAAARTEAEARGLGFAASVTRAQPALLGQAAAEQARYFDMALVGWSAGNPGTRLLAEAILFGSGRPTMLVPDDAPVDRLGRLAIAWDGSRVAARAVADARMLLKSATEISVITVTDEKPLKHKDAGERLAESLRQAGLRARFSPARAGDRPVAETLQRHAAEGGADLLVMGGYGHSRLRDFVLGGATEGVLSDLRIPVLLSH